MTNENKLFTQDFTHATGYFWFGYTREGLALVSTPEHADRALAQWQTKNPAASVQQASSADVAAKRHLGALIGRLEGRDATYSAPLDVHGTNFQLAVWQKIAAVPFGQTISYADLAAHLGKPRAMRAVGTACGANPVPLAFPCHRILRSNGELGGFGLGLDVKESLLAYEAKQAPAIAA